MLWARENGCPSPGLAPLFGFAAVSGKVEMATWFCEQGCPFYGGLCGTAAAFGHLELLVWLQEHMCPIHFDYCREVASGGGHTEMVAWLGQFTAETWHTPTI
jgi:hypothetical protein